MQTSSLCSGGRFRTCLVRVNVYNRRSPSIRKVRYLDHDSVDQHFNWQLPVRLH